MSAAAAASHTLFVDLDGVLADFDSGVKKATGLLPGEQSPRRMWPQLAKISGFYAELPWIPDGQELWNYVSPYRPIILTGVPFGGWAAKQKREWCSRELGSDVPVITCWSKEKTRKAWAELAERGSSDSVPVLVDDRERIRPPWEAAGGIFILHTSAARSIAALKELGL